MTRPGPVVLASVLLAGTPVSAQTCGQLTGFIQSASSRFEQYVRDEIYDASSSDYQIGIVMQGAESCMVEGNRNSLSCDWLPFPEAEAERRSNAMISMVRACLPPQTKTRTFNHQKIVGRTVVFYETRENVEVSVHMLKHVPRSGAPAYWLYGLTVERQ